MNMVSEHYHGEEMGLFKKKSNLDNALKRLPS